MNIPAFSKTYDGVRVLDFPGMALAPGKIYGVLGANGSGKSTFARILAGVLPADREGKPRIDASIGYLPQKHYAYRMSTRKNILLNGKDGRTAAAPSGKQAGGPALRRRNRPDGAGPADDESI